VSNAKKFVRQREKSMQFKNDQTSPRKKEKLPKKDPQSIYAEVPRKAMNAVINTVGHKD
jgi:hypothetical protein